MAAGKPAGARVRALVTGSAGFIGRHLVRRLWSEGIAVCGLDLRAAPPAIAPEIDWVIGDVSDIGSCREAAKGADAVVHLAADPGVASSIEHPRPSLETNVFGTFNVLQAALEVGARRFVFASSGAVLGQYTPPADETTPTYPISPYGASKLAGEAYCSAFASAYGLRSVSLRFANIYGPDCLHKSSVVAAFCKQALSEGRLCVYGDGHQTRDFLFVGDLVDTLVSAVRSDVTGVFQLGFGQSTPVGQVARLLADLFRRDFGRPLGIEYGPPRSGDVPVSGYAVAKAREGLNFRPRVALPDGLAVTWAWFLRTAN